MTELRHVRAARVRVMPVAAPVAVAAVVLVLGGCAPKEDPAWSADEAQVVWSDGEPTSDLESDPWVQAARVGGLAYVEAVNSNDFSDPALHELVDKGLLSGASLTVEERADTPEDVRRFPGPYPFDPLSVDVSEDGDWAEVKGCSVEEWYIFQDSPDVPDTSRTALAWAKVKRADDGTLKFAGMAPSDTPCESENLTVGVYDPLPENWNYRESSVLWLGDEDE